MIDWMVQHFIANIPVWVWAFAAGGGAGGYIISGLASKINALKPYALLLRGISIIVFAASLFMAGGAGVADLWKQSIAAKQAEVDAAQKASADAVKKQHTVYVTKLKVIHDRQVVVKHDIQRDAAKMDAECKLDPVAIKDLNEATK